MKRRGERHEIALTAEHERSVSTRCELNRPMRTIYDDSTIVAPAQDAREKCAHLHVGQRWRYFAVRRDRRACDIGGGLDVAAAVVGDAVELLLRFAPCIGWGDVPSGTVDQYGW